MQTFTVMEILGGGTAQAFAFNYFFSLVSLFGVLALFLGLATRWLTKT